MSDTTALTDHAWIREHAAAYVADGLTTDEALRLEEHMRSCAPCEAVVEEARRLDRGLNALFTPVRPGPELEDFTILKLREGPGLSWTMAFPSKSRRALAAVAALLLLGTFGALAGTLLNDGRLPMPGSVALRSARSDSPSEQSDNLALQKEKVAEVDASGTRRSMLAAKAATTQDQIEKELATGKYSVDMTRGKTSDPQQNLGAESGKGNPQTGMFYSVQNNGLGVAGFPGGGGLGGGIGGIQGGGLGGLGGGLGGLGGGIGGIYGGAQPTAPPGRTNQYSPNFDPIQKPTPTPTETYTSPPKLTLPPGPGDLKDGTSNFFQPGQVKPTLDQKNTAVTPAGQKDPDGGKGDDGQKPAEPTKDQSKSNQKPDEAGGAQKKDSDPPGVTPEPARRIVIRSGDMEFEVVSFNTSLELVTKLITSIKGAFVATVNSEKLPNGKVKGSITVRTPPEALDELVLTLRRELGKTGELKGVKISSQDITKMYSDLESRLRASRTMETRLLQIIKEGKGEIKQLLEAERELGVWRTKIEELEGEIRYYANLASLSTLTISLVEKEIRAAAGLTEKERVQAGVEVEDVDKAYQQVLAAIVEAKGRVMKSELKQLSAGQFNATLNFEVAPESGGPIRDRLRQLGRVARLEIDRVQQADGTLPSDAKLKRGDTVFMVQLYNLANIAPRETATLQVAVADVPAAYQALRNAVAKTSGRVLIAQLNEQDRNNVTAQFDFEVKRTEEGAVRAAVEAAGEIVSRQVVRAPESDNVTDVKVLYRATILAAARLRPRETATYSVAAVDVASAYQALRDAVAKAPGRVINAQFDEHDRNNISAQLDFEVKRGDEAAARAALDAAGETISRQVVRAPDGDGLTDNKVLYKASLFSAGRLRGRDTTVLQLAVTDVPPAYQSLREAVLKANGRIITGVLDEHDKQAITAQLDFEVKRADEPAVRAALEAAGDVIARQVTRAAEAEGVTDTKVTYRATLLTANRLRPRELMTLAMEVPDVERSASLLSAQAAEAKARQVDARISREPSGRVTAKLIYDVPLAAADGLAEQFKKAGTVRVQQSVRDPQAPEGKYTTARIDVTLTSADKIVGDDAGVWPPVKRGLTSSASVLLTSLTWVVFGLCVVLPWALVGYGGYRVVRWMGRPGATSTA